MKKNNPLPRLPHSEYQHPGNAPWEKKDRWFLRSIWVGIVTIFALAAYNTAGMVLWPEQVFTHAALAIYELGLGFYLLDLKHKSKVHDRRLRRRLYEQDKRLRDLLEEVLYEET